MNRRVASDGVLPALPVAAAAVLLLARWLPLRFEYVPNQLGIVSRATLDRYPLQQESFWLVASMALATLLCFGLARVLRAPSLPVLQLVAMELLCVLSLLAVLWLPAALGLPLAVVAVAGSLVLAARGRRQGEAPAPPSPTVAPAARRPAGTAWLAALGALLLALALTPAFWLHLWNVANAVPDELRAEPSFTFQAEIGQHLVWASALARGELHGRDFFCLYGPLYDLGGVALWSVVGSSVAAWELYFSITRVLAMTALLLLGAALLRMRPLAAALVLLVPWINLRMGLAFFGLLFLHGWLRRGGLRQAALAGLSGGVALLYSQEFGLSFLVCALLAFGLRRELRPALVFSAGLAAVVAPVFLWYGLQGALGPMLREIALYPGYMLAGYGKLPFPALASVLPLEPAVFLDREFLGYRLGYGIPAICLGSLLLALPVSQLDWRQPRASAAAVLGALRVDPQRSLLVLTATFGLLAFRTALGRSDVAHMLAASPPAALLLVAGLDRVIAQARAASASRAVAGWRALALALLLFHVGFLAAPTPLRNLRESARAIPTLLRSTPHQTADPGVLRVVRWVQLHTEPSEPLLFLPNDAAYYYLTGRPNPTRFALAHQMVTDAHRSEALADLRANPPRYVFWDEDALRVDGIPDEAVLGPELMAWLDAHYVEARRLGAVRVLRRRTNPNP